jgi:hypothetical protein
MTNSWNLKDKKYYPTHDLGCAAALITSGYKLFKLEKELNGRATFVFLRTDDLEVDLDRYWAGTLLVEARAYFDNQKMLKSRIYGS